MGVHAVWTCADPDGGRRRRLARVIALSGGLAAMAGAAGFWLVTSASVPASDLDSAATAADAPPPSAWGASNRWTRVDTGEGNGSAAALRYRAIANQRAFAGGDASAPAQP